MVMSIRSAVEHAAVVIMTNFKSAVKLRYVVESRRGFDRLYLNPRLLVLKNMTSPCTAEIRHYPSRFETDIYQT